MLRFVFLSTTLLLAAVSTQAQTAPTTTTTPTATTITTGVPVASAAAVRQALAQSGVVLLDVRTPEEFAAGHLSNARNVNFRAADFAAQVSQLDPTKTYVLYCASGNRSGKAAALFQEKGIPKVINAGGFKSLQEGGVK